MKQRKRWINGKRYWVLVSMLWLVLVLAGCALQHQEQALVLDTAKEPVTTNENAMTTIAVKEDTSGTVVYVHVCGAVKTPGVYALKADARIVDAIAAAGGCLKKADETVWNQAEMVTDGQQIYIPSKEETKAKETAVQNGSDSAATGLVNINQATKEQLMTLPGIGEVKAAQIVSYRETNGAFSSIEDIMNIEGIKDGVFQKIKDYITVG